MTVYLPRQGGDYRRYHTDENCQYVPENPKEWSEEKAEKWGYSECQKCAGEMPTGGKSGKQLAAKLRGLES